MYLIVILGTICLIVVTLIVVLLWRRYSSLNPHRRFSFPPVDEWDLPRSQLTLVRKIGVGAFSTVWEVRYTVNIPSEQNEAELSVPLLPSALSLTPPVAFVPEHEGAAKPGVGIFGKERIAFDGSVQTGARSNLIR